ncbi:MAG: hypothetical protein J6C89_00625, partial [Clostridia bacterium]|nr:hypothetical protein [Clostridia bacterium]
MKRILAFLLMLAMLFGSVCTLASCGDMGDETQPSDIDKSTETQTVPTGYSVWNEGDISFLYPSDWNKSDYIGYSMALDDKGNNINLVIENATSYNTELYKNYSVKSATELYKKSFAPYGMTLVNDSVIVEHRTNKNGVDIVYAQYDVVYQGVRKTGYQYIIIGEEQHHTITVTEVNGIKEIVDAVYNSINLKSKMQDKNCVLTFSIDGNEYNVTKDEFDIMMMYRKFELLADLNLTEEWDWLLWNDETDDLCKEFVIDKAKILAVEKYLVDKYNLKLDSEELQKLQYEYSETVKGFGGETDFEEYYGC